MSQHTTPQGELRRIPLAEIHVEEEFNPRTSFDQRKLEELAASIANDGVLQSVLVEPNGDGGYRLIAGERRHPTDRVAGALVVLFAQPLSRIARLTIDEVTIDAGRVTLRLGHTPLELPEPLAGHLRELIETRRSLAAAALPAHERWLFAGASPGRPIGELALGRRLRRLGIACGPNRRAALLELCGQVPAPVLADLLGVNINTASRWAELAGRPKASYLSLRQDG